MEYLIDSWKKAKQLTLIRSSPCGLYPSSKLDKGVNYFILALEKLECVTHYSCEGHFNKNKYVPELYIVFSAKKAIILCLKQMLFNIACLEKESRDRWSIRVSFESNKDKIEKLTYLSDQWSKILGPIVVITNKSKEILNAN